MPELDEFVAHCAECADCRDSLADEVGYPGLCRVGMPMWARMPWEEQDRAGVLVHPDLPRGCRHVANLGSFNNPPEYCDNEAEPGSEFCAVHRYAEEGDNSDEPYEGCGIDE